MGVFVLDPGGASDDVLEPVSVSLGECFAGEYLADEGVDVVHCSQPGGVHEQSGVVGVGDAGGSVREDHCGAAGDVDVGAGTAALQALGEVVEGGADVCR